MGMGLAVGFLSYGERWRRQRRIVQRFFDPQTVHVQTCSRDASAYFARRTYDGS